MVTHTLIFSFPAEMSEAHREQFFREGSAIAIGSGLVESYRHERHIPLANDENSPVFVASALARVSHADVDTMRRYVEYPPVREFVRRWQARFPYQVVWVNTED